MARKPYFKVNPDSPSPLRVAISRRVRFDEVDSMGIVWHGRYISYFEEARVELGRKYHVGYQDFIDNRVPVPIRQVGIDHLEPLRFDDEIKIEAILHWSDAARINFGFEIYKSSSLVCTGFTVQLMLDENFELLLAPPPFYQKFMDKWQRGELV